MKKQDTKNRKRLPGLAMTAVMALALATDASADNIRGFPGKVPAAYGQECAACHTAYPPGMLPARSWQRIMNGLEHHYGTDASLDAASVRQLSEWLQAHAGTFKRANLEPPEDRITKSVWFERKHRKIDPAVWKLAAVKSAGNCIACHTRADRADYGDATRRPPAGMDACLLRGWDD
jgi:mono/diheme cytochrome c family protein